MASNISRIVRHRTKRLLGDVVGQEMNYEARWDLIELQYYLLTGCQVTRKIIEYKNTPAYQGALGRSHHINSSY